MEVLLIFFGFFSDLKTDFSYLSTKQNSDLSYLQNYDFSPNIAAGIMTFFSEQVQVMAFCVCRI